MPLGIFHFFPITSSGTVISMNICAYVLSGWTLEAELLGYEECTFCILIDTSQFPEGQYQFTLPPGRLSLILGLGVSSIALCLLEREQANSLSSGPSCLVTTDASVDL